ncbi:hypothetical protein TKK_0003174 [Trichogramma kaykai]
MQKKVESIHMDFEKAQIKAAKENFPMKKIYGCLFHYKQESFVKFCEIKISTDYNYILKTAHALAYLPSNKIDEGANELTKLIDNLPENLSDRVKLQNFASYIRRFWLPLKDIFSAYGEPIKTNNICENFHYHVARILGSHPPVWKLLSGLNNIMESYTEKYKKVARGGRMRLNLPDHVRSKDFLILQAEEDLALKSSDPFITLSRELPKKKFLPLKAKMKSLLVLDGHSEEASEELVVETNRSDENDTDSETETSDTDEDSDIE